MAEHPANHDLVEEVFGGHGKRFEVPAHPFGFSEPGKGPFDDLAPLQNDEAHWLFDHGYRLAFLNSGPEVAGPWMLDDLQGPAHHLLHCGAQLSSVTSVCPDVLHPWKTGLGPGRW